MAKTAVLCMTHLKCKNAPGKKIHPRKKQNNERMRERDREREKEMSDQEKEKQRCIWNKRDNETQNNVETATKEDVEPGPGCPLHQEPKPITEFSTDFAPNQSKYC